MFPSSKVNFRVRRDSLSAKHSLQRHSSCSATKLNTNQTRYRNKLDSFHNQKQLSTTTKSTQRTHHHANTKDILESISKLSRELADVHNGHKHLDHRLNCMMKSFSRLGESIATQVQPQVHTPLEQIHVPTYEVTKRHLAEKGYPVDVLSIREFIDSAKEVDPINHMFRVTWFSEKPFIIGDEIICGDGNDVEKAEKFLRVREKLERDFKTRSKSFFVFYEIDYGFNESEQKLFHKLKRAGVDVFLLSL